MPHTKKAHTLKFHADLMSESSNLIWQVTCMLVLGTELYLLQGIGGAGGPYWPEHIAVVGQRVHPGDRHLSWWQQVPVRVLQLFVLQGETETMQWWECCCKWCSTLNKMTEKKYWETHITPYITLHYISFVRSPHGLIMDELESFLPAQVNVDMAQHTSLPANCYWMLCLIFVAPPSLFPRQSLRPFLHPL